MSTYKVIIPHIYRLKMYGSDSETEEDNHIEQLITIALKNNKLNENEDMDKHKTVLKKVPRIGSVQLDSDDELSADNIPSNLIRQRYFS